MCSADNMGHASVHKLLLCCLSCTTLHCAAADSYVTQQYIDKLNVIDGLQHTLLANQAAAQSLLEQGVCMLVSAVKDCTSF